MGETAVPTPFRIWRPYNLLMAELRKSDADKYRGFTRLTTEDFDELLSIVKVDISGSSRFRLPISPDVRLAVTLRYLATGRYMYKASQIWVDANYIPVVPHSVQCRR